MELSELQESLQAASEDSIAALLSALRLQLPTHPMLAPLSRQLGQVQLMAAGVAMAMAEASHPHQAASVEDPEPLFRGQFRQVTPSRLKDVGSSITYIPLHVFCLKLNSFPMCMFHLARPITHMRLLA